MRKQVFIFKFFSAMTVLPAEVYSKDTNLNSTIAMTSTINAFSGTFIL